MKTMAATGQISGTYERLRTALVTAGVALPQEPSIHSIQAKRRPSSRHGWLYLDSHLSAFRGYSRSRTLVQRP